MGLGRLEVQLYVFYTQHGLLEVLRKFDLTELKTDVRRTKTISSPKTTENCEVRFHFGSKDRSVLSRPGQLDGSPDLSGVFNFFLECKDHCLYCLKN